MKKEYIDCIALKRRIQREISAETRGMDVPERLAYYQRQVEASPFRHLLNLRKPSKPAKYAK